MSGIDNPLVSIIIPVYNAEMYIRETIMSVFNQTLQDFELIIINDGSTDQTLIQIELAINNINIIDTNINTHPQVIVINTVNRGVANARNLGIDVAKGHYITFLDADDLWTPTKIEKQVFTLDRYNVINNPNNAKVVYSWVDCVDYSGRYIKPCIRTNNQGNILTGMLTRNLMGCGSNALMYRDIVEYFDTTIDGAEDRELYTRLAKKHAFALVPEVQILYRQRSNSLSMRQDQQSKHSFTVLHKIFEDVTDNHTDLKKVAFINTYLWLSSKFRSEYTTYESIDYDIIRYSNTNNTSELNIVNKLIDYYIVHGFNLNFHEVILICFG